MSETVDRFAAMLSEKIRAYRMDDYLKNYAPKHTPEQRAAYDQIVDRDREVKVKPGKKYIKIDVGESGKFMLTPEGDLLFIKAYGVPDPRKNFGQLAAIVAADFDWDGYSIVRKGSGLRSAYGFAGKVA